MKKASTSERLKGIMNARNLRQVDILKLCEPISRRTGVRIAKNDLSQYINGKNTPGQFKLSVLAEALDVSEQWLMGYDVPGVKLPKTSPVSIPVLGYVRAGIPIEAVEEIIDYEEISSELAATGEFFALSIKGDSMEPKMSEGDVVIVRKQESVENGETAVVLVNGNDATVKKFYRSDAGIKLISTNPVYEPFFFTPKEVNELPVSVIGKVVELRAKF